LIFDYNYCLFELAPKFNGLLIGYSISNLGFLPKLRGLLIFYTVFEFEPKFSGFEIFSDGL